MKEEQTKKWPKLAVEIFLTKINANIPTKDLCKTTGIPKKKFMSFINNELTPTKGELEKIAEACKTSRSSKEKILERFIKALK